MAPDLNGMNGSNKYDYSQIGSSGYDIPDLTFRDPQNRRVRVLTIGAGVSGILMAYQIQKYCTNVDHVIFEKNHNIGGTWLENVYPRCGCDIPSHAYTFGFALNPDWPRFFSYSQDIHAYLDKVCEVFGLKKYMTFNTEVIGAEWQENEGEWKVKLKQGDREFEETCDLLLHGTGILNNFKWPDIPGLKDFKGRLCHTARWPKDYQKEQWKNDRVAVIGSGASSIQTVPGMQPFVKHLDVFIRTGVWFVQIANNFGANHEYTTEERATFRSDPNTLVAHAKDIEGQVNGLWGVFYAGTDLQEQTQNLFKARMAEHIKDERLLKGFTPNFGIGCRRITPGDPYMEAIQKENVDVHFTPVVRVTEDGLIGEDDIERKVDAIVCATGFDVSYRPRFKIIGKNGVDLREKWSVCPESYLGLAVPDFPNFITFIGPTWPVENGSVMGPLLTVSEYAIQIIKKMQTENIKSWSPKQDITDSFNEHCQEFIKHTVWKDDCRAWYRNNETGRVNAIWPGSSLHYQYVISQPRYEDFHMTYHNSRNMWAFLGLGWTEESRVNNRIFLAAAAEAQQAGLNEGGPHGVGGEEKDLTTREVVEDENDKASGIHKHGEEMMDVSPYLQGRYVDPKWLAANGMGKDEAKEFVIKAAAEDAANRMRKQLERAEKGVGGDGYNTTGFDGRWL